MSDNVCVMLVFVAFFSLILGWVVSYNTSYIQEVELKAASCYQAYQIDSRTGDKYFTEDYCGGKK